MPERTAAAVVHRLPPTLVAAGLRLRTQPSAPFAAFERDDGARIPLHEGYRDVGKGRWRRFWWATRTLAALRDRGVLDEADCALVDALRAGRTLPAPLEEFALRVEAAAADHSELIERCGRIDESLGREMLAVVPRDDEIDAIVAAARGSVRYVFAQLRRLGFEPERARVLDAGCGYGYFPYALVDAGVAEVHGIDLDVVGDVAPSERRRVRERLAGDTDATVAQGDIRRLPYPDGAFDLVHSSTVVEHLDELARCFTEVRRVLAAGGLAYHGVDPWFGPAGGHALCTLDFPWGHVRLSAEEFERYATTFRPHEARDAIDFYTHGFQRPRLTFGEMAEIARETGFEVVAAWRTPLPLRDPHRALFSRRILRDCRRVHPRTTAADLLALTATFVLRRR